MKSLLIGGAPSVGKSECVSRLTSTLISLGYKDLMNRATSGPHDFMTILEGENNDGKSIRIIVNTPSDTERIIRDFKRFFDENGEYDLLISTVRDHDFYPRHSFFKIMNIDEGSALEVPLAKVTRRGNNRETALRWYHENIQNILLEILKNHPFSII